jgi:hypothetical protein
MSSFFRFEIQLLTVFRIFHSFFIMDLDIDLLIVDWSGFMFLSESGSTATQDQKKVKKIYISSCVAKLV